MATDPKRVKEIFLEAAELPDDAARTAFLDRACGGDAGLRARVEALLRSHDPAGSFLGTPAAAIPDPGHAATRAFSTDRPGDETSGGDDDDEPLTFLAPATRPGSLGRIGHYEALQVLGRGAFGIVFRAFDDRLQRVVAVKVLFPWLAATSPARRRFLREARSSAQVRHENVVQVYEVGEVPLPYIAMEFIPGETLHQRLGRAGPLDVPEVLRIGRQVAEGLAAAHAADLIHRDIKPGNVLLEGGTQRAKITDFGLARAADDASLSQSGIIAGTPMYMAPEQARGEAVDRRADLFSLGSVLYQMVSGRPPFRADGTVATLKRVAEGTPRPIREIIPEAPPWLCDIISKLHARSPDDRFPSARELADLLGHRLAEIQHPAVAPPTGPRDPATPAARRPRVLTRRRAAAAAVFAMLLGGLGFAEATGVTDVRGTVIRLFSPEGTLVVEVDDPGVSIKIDGPDLSITGAGAREIRVKPGRYTVEGVKDGKLVARELVTVTNRGKRVVRVSQEAPPSAPDGPTHGPDRRAAEYVLSIGGIVRVNDQDRAIGDVANLPGESFRLTGVRAEDNKQVTDADLVRFKDCKNLTSLVLWGTQLTDAGMVHFQDIPGLRELALMNMPIGDAGLANFKDCKDLTRFTVSSTHVSDAGLARFKGCKGLTLLNLGATRVTNAGLANFKDCKKLTLLHLWITRVTDAGLANFKGCKDLAVLNLAHTSITDGGLRNFKDCAKLRWLTLNDTPVSDAGLALFKNCTDLTTLEVRGTKVTAAGIRELVKALPQCRIAWDDGAIEPK